MHDFTTTTKVLDAIYNNIPANVKNNIQEYYKHHPFLKAMPYSNSGTLNNAYYNGVQFGQNTPECLQLLCNLMQYATNTTLNFTLNYISIDLIQIMSSITYLTYLDAYDNQNTSQHYIRLCYMPKGKTTFRELELEENNDIYTRLKGVENCLIRNTTHYVRVFKFLNSRVTTIVTDQITPELVYSILIQLPNLIEYTDNEKVKPVYDIFELLYNYWEDSQANIDTEKIQTIASRVICDLDLIEKNLKEFKNNLKEIATSRFTQNYNKKINQIQCKINDFEQQLATLYADLYENQRLHLALTNLPEDESTTDLIELVQHTKYVTITAVTPMSIILDIQAPVKYFDPEDFEIYERNRSSTLNQLFNELELNALHKIFVTQEYKLLLQSIIELKLTSPTYTYPIHLINKIYTDAYTPTCIMNPHIGHHDCWSEAKNVIEQAISNKNYEILLPQLVAATQTINIAESASFIRYLLPDLKNNTQLIKIITPEGDTISWETYLQKIKEEGATNNETTTTK